ncbi:cytochrome b [Chelativorans sp. M5D2P16]|uniref:cytochrome b n=1 Tax=Chelativorans sp. M5D2P16 TaxID=3095678 RepID=UPI002ACA1E16|nr:cytochrome b [Chelativorans sp. M5D2P16]MDZ5697358.1 cytochrome b [Chelativorans sp. M5D2P16]
MSKLAFRNTRDGYGLVAIVFHWALAVLILGQIGLGLVMMRIADQRLAFDLIQWHKSLGLLLLLLIALRLTWRLLNPQPRPPASLRRWERCASASVHLLLYAVFLALPFTGWALVSASVLGIPTLVFGLFLLPHLPVGVSEAGESFWRILHHLLAYTAIVLVAGHALAALRHHLILKDGVLKRMLRPARRTKP